MNTGSVQPVTQNEQIIKQILNQLRAEIEDLKDRVSALEEN